MFISNNTENTSKKEDIIKYWKVLKNNSINWFRKTNLFKKEVKYFLLLNMILVYKTIFI